MNGAAARKIRKSIYGEYSLKHKEYGVFLGIKKELKKLIWPEKKVILSTAGQVLCLGLGAKYKIAKKGDLKAGKEGR